MNCEGQLEDVVLECKHLFLIGIGSQEGPRGVFTPQGNCLYCLSTRSARLYEDIGHASVELKGTLYVGRLYRK